MIVLMGVSFQSDEQGRSETDRVRRVDAGLNLNTYLGAVAAFASINPVYAGAVPDHVLPLPSWYRRYAGARAVIDAGRAIVYLPMDGDLDLGAARKAVGRLSPVMVGVARDGMLWIPEQATPATTLPATVPGGALVLVR